MTAWNGFINVCDGGDEWPAGAQVREVNRPLVLRLLPDRLRVAAWSRLYRPASERWHPLYRAASLKLAPRITMDLVPGDLISDCIAFTGVYDLELSRHLLQFVGRGEVMIDVGANLGYFSLLWAAANPASRCFAFEASPRTIDLLKRNVARNGLDARVQVLSQAAGREHGSLLFDVGPPEQTGWGGFAATSGASAISVEVVRVDEVVTNVDEVALLKIDIEGADTWALMGCERLLRERRIKSLWFEQNKPRMRALGIGEREAEDYLRSVGYLPSPRSDPSRDVVGWSAIPV